MHELGTIEAICNEVESLARKHNAQRVVRIVLEVADPSHFNSKHLGEAFRLLREASPLLRDAELEFRKSASNYDTEIFLRDVEMEVPDA